LDNILKIYRAHLYLRYSDRTKLHENRTISKCRREKDDEI
jgi:hypothetical protein